MRVLTGLQALSQTLPGAFIQILFCEHTENMVCLLRMLRDITKTTQKIKMLSSVIRVCLCTATLAATVICHRDSDTCAGSLAESRPQSTSINASNE